MLNSIFTGQVKWVSINIEGKVTLLPSAAYITKLENTVDSLRSELEKSQETTRRLSSMLNQLSDRLNVIESKMNGNRH